MNESTSKSTSKTKVNFDSSSVTWSTKIYEIAEESTGFSNQPRLALLFVQARARPTLAISGST